MAKVYCDYHPEIHGWDKIGIYALASIPPMIMGYFRLIALRHFPTDILTGFIVGGAVGIAVPEIHRIASKDKGLSFTPYISPAGSGMSLTYNFK
jgi:membrane-associated phospholipid phosphatase